MRHACQRVYTLRHMIARMRMRARRLPHDGYCYFLRLRRYATFARSCLLMAAPYARCRRAMQSRRYARAPPI